MEQLRDICERSLRRGRTMKETELCRIIQDRVLNSVDYYRDIDDSELRKYIDQEIKEYRKIRFLSIKQREQIHKDIFNSLRRLDVIQDLVDDPEITEIMVNGPNHIFIERDGKLIKSERRFSSVKKLEEVIQLIVSKNNRTVNISQPIADARLENGSRVNIILPPIAINGPTITIRRFPDNPITIDRLIELGSLNSEIAEFFGKLVKAKYTIFVSGGTGAGKSTLLNALSDYIPKDERIITIEDNAELQIRGVDNLIRLEARAASNSSDTEVTIRDLLKTSLRARPDRIIIGEIRGAEAIDLIQAVNTGHEGSLSTGHANSPADMLNRLETMVLMGMELPISSIRRQIASGIDIMIHVGRLRDRSRRVLEVTEIVEYSEGNIILNCLYKFCEQGMRNGRVEGYLEKRGNLICQEKLKMAGVSL